MSWSCGEMWIENLFSGFENNFYFFLVDGNEFVKIFFYDGEFVNFNVVIGIYFIER